MAPTAWGTLPFFLHNSQKNAFYFPDFFGLARFFVGKNQVAQYPLNNFQVGAGLVK